MGESSAGVLPPRADPVYKLDASVPIEASPSFESVVGDYVQKYAVDVASDTGSYGAQLVGIVCICVLLYKRARTFVRNRKGGG